MSFFELKKWYLDCVNKEGNVFIGYNVYFKIAKINLNYVSSIYYKNGTISEKYKVLKKKTKLIDKNDKLNWSCKPLAIDGVWTSKLLPIKLNLLNNKNGSIYWHCIKPSADASLQIDNTLLNGKGYVEYLEMTMKPWQLPFNELRWGRFISNSHYLVWINWKVGYNKTLVIFDGTTFKNAEITDSYVKINDEILLDICDNRIIRDGNLNNTILNKIPILNKISSLKLFKFSETKWLGKGTLKKSHLAIESGWAIHEIVKFK